MWGFIKDPLSKFGGSFGRHLRQSQARKLRFIKLACMASPQSLRSSGVAHVENPARRGRHVLRPCLPSFSSGRHFSLLSEAKGENEGLKLI
jgi:hypothetical protein